MPNVIFKIGTKEEYNNLTVKDPYTLYWLADKLELRKGDELYGTGREATELVSGLMSSSDKVRLISLIGDDSGKSVRTIAREELAEQLVPKNAKESLDTLTEIAAWIQSHPDDASAMNAAIAALKKIVDTGDESVSTFVRGAIAALHIEDYALAEDLLALAQRMANLEKRLEIGTF